MSTSYVFNPRDPRYKTPYGACLCSSNVSFTLRPLSQENFIACTLLIYEEFHNLNYEINIPEIGNNHTLFSGNYTCPDHGELIWYAFRFTRQDGSCVFFGQNGYCYEHELKKWQLTVYAENTGTPEWFGTGITYQIFPDRFYRAEMSSPEQMIGNRVFHNQWNEQPEFRPDDRGEILNNDFFGGNLRGITEKLDYLASLHVTTLYLCPIFEADSNHRYNTADYLRIDPLLGTEDDFRTLCKEAELRGIRIMLDGVFNHTGSNSRYFNVNGYYEELGAAQSKDSRYADWFQWRSWPDDYESWWGIRTLPAVNENNPDYRRYIISGDDSVVRHWIRCGACGWRLDVADELPDDFIEEIRTAMDAERPDSFLLGEVWEDGSNKISYSRRRKYLLGKETHGLMNYPFRTAAIDYLRGGDAAQFKETMEVIRENYPKPAFYSGMNSLGTHDTPRILTTLGYWGEVPAEKSARAAYHLTDEQRLLGLRRLRLGTALMFTFPGSPTIYYGDEAGMEGFEDPLNRGTYPWENIDNELLQHFQKLGAIRSSHKALQCGEIQYLKASGGILSYLRSYKDESVLVLLNNSDETAELTVNWPSSRATDALSGRTYDIQDDILHIAIPPISTIILV